MMSQVPLPRKSRGRGKIVHFVAKRAKRLFGAYISLIICQSIVPDWGQRERSAAWKRLRASEVRRNLSRIFLLVVVGGAFFASRRAPLVPRYAPVVVIGAPVRRNALSRCTADAIMALSAKPPAARCEPGCEKGPAMVTASNLAILVGAVALVCVVCMMLHLRGETTRKRVDDLERRVAELSSSREEDGR